jgi:hypothetical protein
MPAKRRARSAEKIRELLMELGMQVMRVWYGVQLAALADRLQESARAKQPTCKRRRKARRPPE